jgi:hypothetical protein
MQKTILSICFAIFLSFTTLFGIVHVNAQVDETSTQNMPTIQITSHEDGQQVSVGELVLEGNSSDTDETDCQVYADVNDIPPLQNTTAEGPNGEDDFSEWSFEYTEDYQLIKSGDNELTARISCFDNSIQPLSEWHSINVTGIGDGGDLGAVSTESLEDEPSGLPLPTIDSGEGNTHTDEGDTNGEEEGVDDESP